MHVLGWSCQRKFGYPASRGVPTISDFQRRSTKKVSSTSTKMLRWSDCVTTEYKLGFFEHWFQIILCFQCTLMWQHWMPQLPKTGTALNVLFYTDPLILLDPILRTRSITDGSTGLQIRHHRNTNTNLASAVRSLRISYNYNTFHPYDFIMILSNLNSIIKVQWWSSCNFLGVTPCLTNMSRMTKKLPNCS